MRTVIALVVAAAASAAPPTALGFRKAAAGTHIPDRTLATIDGKQAHLLAPGKVSVFVFVRTGQDHSQAALKALAGLERELERKPVRFVAVVSDTEPVEEVVKLAQEAGIRMPVLVDQGDELYGELGVAMHPSAGIVDPDGRLEAFQPFRKVNYADAMRGRVQVALGELDEAGLAAILDPVVPVQTGAGRAHARVKLSRTLLKAGIVDKAVESARAAIFLDPQLADAHQALSEALAKEGRCDEAEREAAFARKLAPSVPAHALACRR